jgi:hypothetical protein
VGESLLITMEKYVEISGRGLYLRYYPATPQSTYKVRKASEQKFLKLSINPRIC